MRTIKIAVEVSDTDSPVYHRRHMSFSLEQIQDLTAPVEVLGNVVFDLIYDVLGVAERYETS